MGITIKTKLGLVLDEHIHIYINNYRLPWQSCPFTSSGYQALSSCGLARRLIYTIQVYNWYTLYHWYLCCTTACYNLHSQFMWRRYKMV